jgi:hypothetical protein
MILRSAVAVPEPDPQGALRAVHPGAGRAKRRRGCSRARAPNLRSHAGVRLHLPG